MFHPVKTLAATVLFCLAAQAQTAKLQLAALEKLAARATETVDVTLDGQTLKMAAQFLEGNAEAKEATRSLQGIYVRVFEFDKPGAYSAEDVNAIRSQLQGWARIVSVKNKKDGDVDVYVLGDGQGGNLGLVVLATEEKELTVVNIVGSIDLKKLSSLEGKMGIPKLATATGKAKPGKKGE